MKSFRILCIFLFMQSLLQAQTDKKPEERFINANAEASINIAENSIVDFYTTEELTFGTIVIPIHTKFSTSVRLYDGRAYLRVSSVKVGDTIYTIDWRIVGSDFKEGLPFIETNRTLEVYEDQKMTFKAYTNL
jgi:hypothetical protein